MNLKELCKQSHAIAKNKGFWDNKRETGTLLMLIVSELAEALEADRQNRRANLTEFATKRLTDPTYFKENFKRNIKDTFEDELADTFIRLADLCEGMNIDIEKFIKLKMEYNATREHKHGKNY
jgi:NTP pyrophosphatase (non-canonical NTP hydrolase)